MHKKNAGQMEEGIKGWIPNMGLKENFRKIVKVCQKMGEEEISKLKTGQTR